MSTYSREQLLQLLRSLLLEVRALQMLVQPSSHEQKDTPHPIDHDALRMGLEDLHGLACQALVSARQTLTDLPPPALEGRTLPDALSDMVEETADRLNLASRISLSGIENPSDSSGGRRQLSLQDERLLYLVAREALYLVEWHPQARHLRLTLTYGSNDVSMSLEDDGLPAEGISNPMMVNGDDQPQSVKQAPPFDQSFAESGYVVRPIIEDLRVRIEQAGGSLEITSLEHGTRLTAHLPYAVDAMTEERASSTSRGRDLSVESADDASIAAINEGELSSPARSEAGMPITILIVDSQAVIRAGLQRLLEAYAGLAVISEAADGVQAVSETLELGPQVVLMDADLPDGQSLESLRQIKQLNLDTKVLLLGTQDREEYLYEMLRAGADGYVLKDIAPDDLAQSVRSVARGDVLVQPQLAGRILSRFGREGRGNHRYDALTARELEVLRLLVRGLRNKEIAARLYVSERTINFHLANIYQKLNVSGRTEALSKAIEQGLVTP